MNHNPSLQEVFDRRLSGIRIEPKHWNHMIRDLKGDPVVKKKTSAAFVFVILAVLLAGIALAAVTLQNTGKEILEAEQAEGYYENWQPETKASLVKELAVLEYIEITPDVQRLIADKITDTNELARIADEAMAAFTGVDVSEISFLIIMQAALGPFDAWSVEEQAWYSQLLAELDLHRDGVTLFVLPTSTIDEDTAVALARAAIAETYGVDESVLDAYKLTTSFQIPEFAEAGDDTAYWYVGYEKPLDMPAGDALFTGFELFINPDTGEFYETVEEIIQDRNELQAYLDAISSNPLIEDIHSYMEANQLAQRPTTWTLEQFADFSAHFHERGLKELADNPNLFSSFLPAILTYAYGLPDDQAISQSEAQAIAEDAIVTQVGRNADEIMFYTHEFTVMYDITDPEIPLWKFYFIKPSVYGSDTDFTSDVASYYGTDSEQLSNIKVEINAYTGELVRAFTIDFTYDWDADPNGDGLSDFNIALYMQVF